ncbi:TatD family hydrolase [bacterium]|nr:TatD family hydrolase [bacterium]
MFIDTHCHLTDATMCGENLSHVLARAADAHVDTIICPTADPADIDAAIAIAMQNNNVWATIGIHPEYAGADATKYLTDDVLKNPRIVGIGEIGLDYHYGTDNRMAQIELFKIQLDIARRAALPVAIHTREAESDTAEILTGDVGGVMHCYTSSWDLAKKMLDRGFFFSASGILTFKNSDTVRETFRKIPIDRIVIETDGPYCAPVPHRGKSCEPFMVADTARVLAMIKGVDIETLMHQLHQNTHNLYPRMC